MAVPDTNTFTLQEVIDEVNPTTNDLKDCFADANDSRFDSLYSGAKNSLLNFRNYNNNLDDVLVIGEGVIISDFESNKVFTVGNIKQEGIINFRFTVTDRYVPPGHEGSPYHVNILTPTDNQIVSSIGDTIEFSNTVIGNPERIYDYEVHMSASRPQFGRDRITITIKAEMVSTTTGIIPIPNYINMNF